MLVPMRLARPGNAHGPFLFAHHQRYRAIGNRAAVQQMQRRGDRLGIQHRLYVDGLAQLRQGVPARVAAHQHRQLGQILPPRAGGVHVRRRQQRVIRRHRRAIGDLGVCFAHLRQRLDGRIHGLARQAVLSCHHQHPAARTRAHQLARQHHHARAGRPAHLHAVRIVRIQPQLFAQQARQHQMRKGRRIPAQHAVDGAALTRQTGALQRGLGRFRHQVQRAAPLMPAKARHRRAVHIGMREG
ncbi:hypothetical protein D3C71_487580 [compost metagenome]